MADQVGMDDVQRLQRRLERERRARRDAELIAERSSSALYERQRELELLVAVSAAANRSSTPDEALAVVLPGLCSHLSWLVAQAWVRDEGDGMLRCSPVHHVDDPGRFEDFVADSRRRRFAPGEGLPGRVLATGTPVWVSDVTADPNFPRAPLARAAGLHAAVAFPVIVGDDVVAVLECFAMTEIAPTDDVIRVVGRVGESLSQVFERERGERRLRHEARHDSLTGLPNRVAYRERLDAFLGTADGARLGLAVAMLDLDRFREVNDTLGHDHGDRLLVEVGRRLSGVLGRSDVIARLGGDEFALILPRVRTDEDAAVVASRIATVMRDPVGLQEVTVAVDTSIGIALHPRDGADARTLMRHADVALYEAKRSHSGHAVYSPPLTPAGVGRLGLLTDLREAIEQDELTLHHQPKVSVATGRLEGVEALVRWDHPERGPVSPVEFIPLAERTGLIRPLTTLVMRRALAQARAWRDGGMPIPVAVNITARTLLEDRFPSRVAEMLDAVAVPAELLELEITEGTMVEDPDRTRAALVALHELGVSIAIDDFGTGFSSLGHLKALPVGCLKIDRSFVSGMALDDRDGFIVRAAVRLGHDLGMRVVAEGVEDEATLAALEGLGCDIAQGYLFHRPAPAAALAQWLSQRTTDVDAAPLLSA